MSSDSNDREAKAFAWRAIGCAVWLGIGIVILLVAGSFLASSQGLYLKLR